MTLTEAYQLAIQQGEIHADSEQARLIPPLQNIANAVQNQTHWYQQWFSKPKIQGLYITGPVGAGKTYMMDLFYQNLPTQNKLRAHFLSFMQQIDQKLRFLQGQRDPVLQIAKDIARHTRILCIDEFMVEDMAHAMILGELLHALFASQVVLVATSNTKIDDLYQNGLNRERFLPAIALLHHFCDEINLHSAVDYRLGKKIHIHAYLYPLTSLNSELLAEQFQELAGTVQTEKALLIQQRWIEVVALGQRGVWFDFTTICAMPRCQLDYIELAERYSTVVVSNIPQLTDSNTGVILFIQLVDVLYDRGIRLLISAAVPVTQLYTAGPFLVTFQRTLSRLEEMQSEDYLNRHCQLS